MDPLLVGVLAALAIVATAAISPRLGISTPLLLVFLGVCVGFLPFVPAIEVEPEWILAWVLPPLLYATSVSMPVMEFRRDFTAISGLSVALVVISAVILGFMFTALIPGIQLSTGIALGAIVSPTDAVATSIVRRLGVSPRLVTMLEGESLLNDASALVLLRSAIAATAASVTLLGVAWDFLLAVVVAAVVGLGVGRISLMVRKRVTDTSVNVAISFVVPFIAYIPAEALGASGLVAAVVAGLVAGAGAARYLRPEDRLAESINWRTLEVLLEGAVFFLMGLQVYGLVEEVEDGGDPLWVAGALGLLAAMAVLLIRTGYLAPLLWWLGRRARLSAKSRDHLTEIQGRIDLGEIGPSGPFGGPDTGPRGTGPSGRKPRRHRHRKRRVVDADERAKVMTSRITRRVADIDYLLAEPLGWREGAVLVWAGMRGAVTVAAAQSLPADTPKRATLVLVAYVVASGTLLVQGGTLGWLVNRLGVARAGHVDHVERRRLVLELKLAAAAVVDDPDLERKDGSRYDEKVLDRIRHAVTTEDEEIEAGSDAHDARVAEKAQVRELRMRVIAAQREALLDARALGTYSSEALRDALRILDADEMSGRLRDQ